MPRIAFTDDFLPILSNLGRATEGYAVPGYYPSPFGLCYGLGAPVSAAYVCLLAVTTHPSICHGHTCDIPGSAGLSKTSQVETLSIYNASYKTYYFNKCSMATIKHKRTTNLHF